MILSGYQFLVKSIGNRRPQLNNVWKEVFPANGPQGKSLIEISGAPGTGKRILLYELIARTSLKQCGLDGGSNQVIFVNLCHKFDTKHFVEYIQSVISKNDIYCQRPIEEVIQYSSNNIIYLPCYSADEFEFSFENVGELLWEYKRVSLLAIDGLDTFYWDECNQQLQRMGTHYKKLIQRLKPLCQEHGICCAYTVDDNYSKGKLKSSFYFPHSLIDYKLRLIKHIDGSSYLNDSLIEINDYGIEFLNK